MRVTADMFLSRLAGVRRTGSGRWIARCPAHDDRHPSMTIRELDDGRVLVHDFGGCPIEDVLAAVGLDWDAVMPERAINHHIRRERRPHHASDILASIAIEALIVALAASDICRGKTITDTDRERVMLAASRLGAAAEMGGAS